MACDPGIEGVVDTLAAGVGRMETRALFTGEYDDRDAIVEINSGAGGVDAQDWAEMLLRMYLRWAERHGFDTAIEAATDGTEAGIPSAEFPAQGRPAYGWRRAAHGAHRLLTR